MKYKRFTLVFVGLVIVAIGGRVFGAEKDRAGRAPLAETIGEHSADQRQSDSGMAGTGTDVGESGISSPPVTGRTAPATDAAPSLCADGEQVLLSWQVIKNAKLVSLCASRDFGKDTGYIQYRFGRPGAIELEFPNARTATQSQFTYSHYFRARVDRTEISFKTDRKYTLSDDYEGEGGKNLHSYTIVIESPDGESETQIKCRPLRPSELAKLGEALPNSDDSN